MIGVILLALFGSPTKVDSLYYTSINEGDSFNCKRFIKLAKKHHIKKSVVKSYLRTAKKTYICEDK